LPGPGPWRRRSLDRRQALLDPVELRERPVAPCPRLLEVRRRDRRGDHRDQTDALEHQDHADHAAIGLGGHHVAVADRRHGLERPPEALVQARELVAVDQPGEQPADQRDREGKERDQLERSPRGQASALQNPQEPRGVG
jgi:hypothetical protein